MSPENQTVQTIKLIRQKITSPTRDTLFIKNQFIMNKTQTKHMRMFLNTQETLDAILPMSFAMPVCFCNEGLLFLSHLNQIIERIMNEPKITSRNSHNQMGIQNITATESF